ncbi:MAG: hypothetical protein IJW15_04065 [Clostridia bacterium]|nr:hypothetical protein [Clostridia bacterium]
MDIISVKNQILKSIKKVESPTVWHKMTVPINSETINAALKEHKAVKIPYIGEPITIDEPIIMESDNHLFVDEKQILRQQKDSETCMLRNKSIRDGALAPTDGKNRDRNISVEGGIWNFKTAQRCFTDKEKSMQGSLGILIFSGVERISLKNMKIFDDPQIGIGDGDSSYAVQICDCCDFEIENIDFCANSRDGVHINGPANRGHVKHLRGAQMGDDMVALNAWDWDRSAITFGTIENIVVEDLESNGNELRLLPGQKVYESCRVDCDIRNCVLENISGIYTVKMYAQPNIDNAIDKSRHDVSGTVGNIYDVYFKDMTFSKVQPAGFHGLPVKGFFEICADCHDVYMENIKVSNTFSDAIEKDLRFINVGPLSAVWTNDSENPDDWGEVFDPDAVCHIEDFYLENIHFEDGKVDDKQKLTREVHMTVNENYPQTTPKGGTGYGTIGRVSVK